VRAPACLVGDRIAAIEIGPPPDSTLTVQQPAGRLELERPVVDGPGLGELADASAAYPDQHQFQAPSGAISV